MPSAVYLVTLFCYCIIVLGAIAEEEIMKMDVRNTRAPCYYYSLHHLL